MRHSQHNHKRDHHHYSPPSLVLASSSWIPGSTSTPTTTSLFKKEFWNQDFKISNIFSTGWLLRLYNLQHFQKEILKSRFQDFKHFFNRVVITIVQFAAFSKRNSEITKNIKLFWYQDFKVSKKQNQLCLCRSSLL